MSTHIDARKDQIAPFVLMPGDPIRAETIAMNLLKDWYGHNRLRNEWGFTGFDESGRAVTVQASGMGMPSLGIYVHELWSEYNVTDIVRVGTCGAYHESLNVGDIVIATNAYYDDELWDLEFSIGEGRPDEDLEHEAYDGFVRQAFNAAKNMGLRVRVGSIHSTHEFYPLHEVGLADDVRRDWQRWAKLGVIGVEMESAELFRRAEKYGIRAASILMVSDRLFDLGGQHMSKEERENSGVVTAKIALELR